MTQSDSVTATQLLQPFVHSLPLALLKAREAVTLRFRPTLREHGLTEQQWRVLRTLWTADKSLRPVGLSQLTFISMPSLSRLLKTLEGRQLIQRGRHVGDLRGAEFTLMPAGKEMVSHIVPVFETIYAHIDELLGRDQSEQLFGILDHVVQRLGLPDADELNAD